MSRRAAFLAGFSLSLLPLGGCLLADVGIDPELDQQVSMPSLQAAGMGGMAGSSGVGGASGGSSMPPATGSGGGGAGGSPIMMPPAMGGSGGVGSGGTGNSPANLAGAGGGNSTPELCPAGLDREQACAAYCGAYELACRDAELPDPEDATAMVRPYDYDSGEACARFCLEEAPWNIGTIGELDSIMCRCYHSTLAMTMGRNPHCFHAARVPSQGGCAPLP